MKPTIPTIASLAVPKAAESRPGSTASETRIRLLRELAAAKKALTVPYFRQVTALPEHSVIAALNGLRRAGRVNRTGHGQRAQWELPESAKRHLDLNP